MEQSTGRLVTGQDFAWPGAFNAREFAGLPVTGGAIRQGALFRSGKPEAWDAAGFTAAAQDGVRRIIDLRDPSEPGGAPEHAESAGIEYRFVPVEDPSDPAFKKRFQPYMNHPSGYLDFLEMFGDRVAKAVAEVLGNGPGTLVCCSAGRDRTGLVSTVTLLTQGADREALLQQDELAVRAVNERHRGRSHPYESWQPEESLAELVGSRRTALEAFLAEFDERAFLADKGVTERMIDRAADWLVAS
ncbi:MAG: tyrosine-protein phosphatase [Gulosibacter sp.]|uniref:tyrosine-protein phosphatase n=1 Tax=Gulosibacter sp. TaxID=2817531 RepID=UPI003F902494